MFRRIVAPLDGSELAECTLGELLQVAGKESLVSIITVVVPMRIKLHLDVPAQLRADIGALPAEPADSAIKVTSVMGLPGPIGEVDSHAVEALEIADRKTVKKTRNYLIGISGKLGRKGVKVESEILLGKPAEEIIRYTMKKKADLLVLSTHGRSGISRWAYGSVADKILRRATMPVLLVTPSGCRLWD